MRNFYSHLKAISSCQGEMKWQTGRGQSFSLILLFLMNIPIMYLGPRKGRKIVFLFSLAMILERVE